MDSEIDKALKFKQGLQKLAMSPVKAADYVSPLEGENMVAKGSAILPEAKQVIKGTKALPESKQLVKGVADNIDTKGVQKLLTGSAFQDKLVSILKSRAASKAIGAGTDLSKVASTGLKSIPLLGSLVAGGLTFAATGDANAAMQEATPFVNEAGAVGPEIGSLEHKLESGTATPEELAILRNRVQ